MKQNNEVTTDMIRNAVYANEVDKSPEFPYDKERYEQGKKILEKYSLVIGRRYVAGAADKTPADRFDDIRWLEFGDGYIATNRAVVKIGLKRKEYQNELLLVKIPPDNLVEDWGEVVDSGRDDDEMIAQYHKMLVDALTEAYPEFNEIEVIIKQHITRTEIKGYFSDIDGYLDDNDIADIHYIIEQVWRKWQETW